ncbi:MAG: hypothetical protein ABH871_06000 [Pseudomonadota bacterium]
MKKLLIPFVLILISTTYNSAAFAQQAFQPEYLGNASAPQKQGFSLKFFPSYYYQQGISAHDVEVAFEPQFWIAGFTGDAKKDQLQFVIHMPIGYRNQKDANNTRQSVTGIGMLTTTIEYYWHFIDTDDLEFWFDNGITAGWPTATENQGVHIGSHPHTVQIGARSYSLGWYQESFIRYKRFMLTIMPIAASWGFRDDKTRNRGGLSLTIMNGSAGYALNSWAHLGINFGLLLGNVTGAEDVNGNSLARTVRFFTGPAALLSFDENTSLQIGVLIDAATKNTNRGEGIAMALWHFF